MLTDDLTAIPVLFFICSLSSEACNAILMKTIIFIFSRHTRARFSASCYYRVLYNGVKKYVPNIFILSLYCIMSTYIYIDFIQFGEGRVKIYWRWTLLGFTVVMRTRVK